ncbi:hypothetical protein PYCC9005_003661 [Savitreella phatthalungensis]
MDTTTTAVQTNGTSTTTEINLPALPACSTLYVRNLSERMSCLRLRRCLSRVFRRFRPLDVRVGGSVRGRGQAWVTLPNVRLARDAMRVLQGLPVAAGKPMLIQFAATESDRSVVRRKVREAVGDGKGKGKTRRKLEGMTEDAKKEVARVLEEHQKERRRHRQERRDAYVARHGGFRTRQENDRRRTAKGRTGDDKAAPQATATTTTTATTLASNDNPPNKLLFIQNLPPAEEGGSAEVLGAVFGRFAGFVEVRVVPGDRGLAFVEYSNVDGATAARDATAGLSLGGVKVSVGFAKPA